MRAAILALVLTGCMPAAGIGCHPFAHILITPDCQTKLCTPIEAVGGFWGGLECRY